jgi:hypothetical protein
MRRSLLSLLSGCCASVAAQQVEYLEPHRVGVEISRDADDWIAEYSFNRPVDGWFFPRSSLAREGQIAWRQRDWTVETPGVKLTRRGHYDVLESQRGGMPAKVRVRFKPFTGDLLDDYAPAVGFTDGGFALLSAQFDVLPLKALNEADVLPSDLNNNYFAETLYAMRFDDGEKVFGHGGGFATYVLFGPTRRIEARDVVTVFDPQLPAWIHDSLEQSVTGLLARYAGQLGPLPEGKPTVMVAWGGPTKGIVTRAGGALRGQIVMKYEGDGLLNETPRQRAEGLWFVAHEAAHFWLGQTVGYDYAREAWITEGGAELLAVRAIAALDPAYDWRIDLDRDIRDCVTFARGHGIESARDRNEHRAYYACGAVFALVAEAAGKSPFHVFVRRLIDENRGDGIVSRAEWLGVLDAVSGDSSLSRDISGLLDQGSPDAAPLIASLFDRAGVVYVLDEQKIPRMK